ncbi:MAG: hypothetical protein WCT20_01110, partial [Candidatus Babeliales bacterium]
IPNDVVSFKDNVTRASASNRENVSVKNLTLKDQSTPLNAGDIFAVTCDVDEQYFYIKDTSNQCFFLGLSCHHRELKPNWKEIVEGVNQRIAQQNIN